jgi:hypothetical protein
MLVTGWSDDGTKIRALDDAGGNTRAGWEISLVGNARRRWLEWPRDAVSLSPDNSKFLKLGEQRELQVVPRTGGLPRAVRRLDQGEPFQAGHWTADSKRVFLLRHDGARLETFGADRGEPSVVFTPPAGEQIRNFCIPGRDGRLIVLMGARTLQTTSTFGTSE